MIKHLYRAVRPSIFDVAATPELAFAILLANLMSPRLWELSDTIRHRPAEDKMAALHDYVNSHFKHVLQQDIIESWGTFVLDEERERVGADIIDPALEVILASQEKRRELGLLPKEGDISDLISQGLFPAYFYSTIDEAAACRRLLGRRKHKPIGLTNCLDEAAIIGALLCLFVGDIPQNLCFFGSAYHYSTFLAAAPNSIWFNGKKDYFSQSDWRYHADNGTRDSGQGYFDTLLFVADRLITPSGHFLFADRVSTSPQPELESVAASLVDFFGVELRQMANLSNLADVRYRIESMPVTPAAAFVPEGAVATQARIRQLAVAHPNSIAAAALYCFRSFSVPDSHPYLKAACRSLDSHHSVPRVASIEEACARTASVAGTESIFEDRGRIAMPDEVLHYGTGTDRDKALLLYALLAEMTGSNAPKPQSLSIHFTDAASYVAGPGFLINAQTLTGVNAPDGAVLAQWGPA